MNSFKKLSFLMITAALILSPVAKAADEPATNTQAMKAAPVVAGNPTTDAGAPNAPGDKTLLAKPAPTKKEMKEAAACDGGKKCKMGDDCKCKGKKHCKYCKDKHEHADESGTSDAGPKTPEKTN